MNCLLSRVFLLILLVLSFGGCSDTAPKESGAGGLRKVQGRVLVPLEGTYLYIYQKGMDLYGPAFSVSQATGPDGAFDLQLPEGEYVVVARKRKSGDASGPVVAGDNKSEFMNLTIRGDLSDLTLIAPVKAGDQRQLTAAAPVSDTGLSGVIRNADGQPQEGARVHVYDHIQMSERPKYVSEKTGPDGRYLLHLPEGGTYYLAARDKFGGPPKLGDLYGRYDQGTIEPSAVVVRKGEILQEINITVTKVW